MVKKSIKPKFELLYNEKRKKGVKGFARFLFEKPKTKRFKTKLEAQKFIKKKKLNALNASLIKIR